MQTYKTYRKEEKDHYPGIWGIDMRYWVITITNRLHKTDTIQYTLYTIYSTRGIDFRWLPSNIEPGQCSRQ